MHNNIVNFNAMNFHREVLHATRPVLVEFWAGRSDPCKAMAPMLESVAAKVTRVNVERQERLTEQCGVRAVPTLLIFNQGCLQDQIVGRTSEQAVRERLER